MNWPCRLQRHVNKVASVCFHHIRRLRKIRRLLGTDLTAALFSAFVLSRLDYCNAILAGLPRLPHCTATTCTERCSQTDSTSVSTWPRNQYTPGITLASCTIGLPTSFVHTHAPHPVIHTGHWSSTVISNRHCHTNSYCRFKITSSVRQQPIRYEQPRTRLKLGQQAFSYAAPAAWNTLPTSLQQIPNTETFERHLKTFLFCQAFWLRFLFYSFRLF